MDTDQIVRFYVSVPTETLPVPVPPTAAGVARRKALAERLREITRQGCRGREQPIAPRPVDTPSDRIIAPAALPRRQVPERGVISFRDTARNAEAFLRQLGQAGADIRAGVDLAMAAEAWWRPGQGPACFGDRAAAERLVRAGGLRDPARDARGNGAPVNIVIVDQGLRGATAGR